MSSFQVLMVAMCFILNFNDGIDVLIVSFSSPEIIQDLGLSKVEMGYIFSAGLAGMTLGCFLIAPKADLFGRRKIFLISVAMVTVGMYGVWFFNSYGLIVAFRFLTGLGIGGILPTMTATTAEFSNKKYRDFNVGLVQAGWPIGAILTGFFCSKYIPIYGWHQAFFVAGTVSFIMLLMVYFLMTDSLEFMLKKPGKDTLISVNKLLTKLQIEPLTTLPIVQTTGQQATLNTLLNTTYARNTLIVWNAAFFGFLTLYTLMSWVPTIAKDSGMAFVLATWVGITLNVGAALGSASVGLVGGKTGMRQSMLTYMLIAFVVMQLYAILSLTVQLIFILVFFIGFFVQGGFNGIWPLLSRLYPAEIRATGVGFTVGIGRLGAVLGPLIFGYMSDLGFGTQTLFMVFSVPLLIMGVSVWLVKSKDL